MIIAIHKFYLFVHFFVCFCLSIYSSDGSHIKGLVINLFATFWPELLRIEGFMQEFITPIVKMSKGKGNNEKVKRFYSIPDFEEWLDKNNNGYGWTQKYYKGLGTSTSLEAREYFSNLDKHQIEFKYSGKDCDKAIRKAYNKGVGKADIRKEWLAEYDPETSYLDQTQGFLTYQDFINKELILFSIASTVRAIPSLIDGLKPGQRKILYVCFKRHLVKEIKTAQLAGLRKKYIFCLYNCFCYYYIIGIILDL